VFSGPNKPNHTKPNEKMKKKKVIAYNKKDRRKHCGKGSGKGCVTCHILIIIQVFTPLVNKKKDTCWTQKERKKKRTNYMYRKSHTLKEKGGDKRLEGVLDVQLDVLGLGGCGPRAHRRRDFGEQLEGLGLGSTGCRKK
jgi:hypothetical protein